MLDPLSKSAYDDALSEHRDEVDPALRRLEAAIESAANANTEPAEVTRLRTTRVILLSGLFDAEFYVKKYADIRAAKVDPLEHYVWHGDREERMPNPAFFPSYYRREFMTGLPVERNALEHYIEIGERSGAKPNSAFDPRAYLAANPGLAEFVDRPLFHYLRIGQFEGEGPRGTPAAMIFPTLEYVEAVAGDGREDRHGLARAKRAFFDRVSVPEGFATYKELVRRPDHAEIHWKRLAGLREVAGSRPGAFRATAPAGEPFVVELPRVIGEGDHRPLTGRTREMFVACLIDARVRTHSNIIEIGDVAVLDYEGEEFARIDNELELEIDPAIFRAGEGGAWVMTPQGEAAAIEIEEAFSLLGVYASEFGHWMLEFLPKYLAAWLSGALPRVPVLIEADMPESHRQALELVLPEGVEILELPGFTTARVRRLWCAPTLMYFAVFEKMSERFRWEYFATPPNRYAPVVREMARRVHRACGPQSGFDRVFLARRPSKNRKLVNHTAIEAIAQARGFLVVYPEDSDFVEQANLLRHARYVLGPDGSAMFLAFFAQPGTKLCTLTNAYGVLATQADRTALFAEIGLNVTVITGPAVRVETDCPMDSDFEIDEEEFCRFLDRWLAT